MINNSIIIKTKQGLFLIFLLLFVLPVSARKPGESFVRRSGDVAAGIVPVAAFVTTLVLKDYEGTQQLIGSALISLTTTYALKTIIDKERRDGSNFNSFPSAHASVSFQGATFLQRRYGWKAGVPAYILSTYVAWSRVYVRKHDIWDVAAGAVIGAGCSLIFTTPFAKKHQLVVSPTLLRDEVPGVYASFKF